MKKKIVLSLFVTLFLLSLSNISISEAPVVLIPSDVMDSCISNNSAGEIIEQYFYPMLNEDDGISLLFASELNISNGCPHEFGRSLLTKGWGERAMFGRLITAGTVEKYMETSIRPDMGNSELAELARAETYRLLFGKPYNDLLPNTNWLRSGNTTFNFYYRHMDNGKTLDYSTGKWVKTPGIVWCIRIRHTTEYYGETRYAYIACDWKHEKDGYYTATFSIVH